MNNNVTKQNGAALVVGLIMLLVMTLLGVTSMNTTRTELRIANNLNNHSTAFQTAALIVGRALVDPLIDWNSSSTVPQQGSYVSGYESSDGLRTGSFEMKFSGCRPATASSLTGRAGALIIHEITATGNVESTSGDIVGVSRQTNGYSSIAAGCATL